MNKHIIQKCIEELRKPKLNKQYVLGMLEAMSDIGEGQTFITPAIPSSRSVEIEEHKAITPIFTETVVDKKREEKTDPSGELETPEQRKARVTAPKVPPAFLGNTSKMHLDPSLTDGRTDVTPIR